MGFGAGVSTLLETYENCLQLLKAFKTRKTSRPDSASAQQTLLRRSVRADRDKVQRAYSSRLSLAGSRFAEGDAKARSSLSRILRKLTNAITDLIRLVSRSQSPKLDYESLMSLSNSSRIDAIKTINRLSQRLSMDSCKTSMSCRTAGTVESKARPRPARSIESPPARSETTRRQSAERTSASRSKPKALPPTEGQKPSTPRPTSRSPPPPAYQSPRQFEHARRPSADSDNSKRLSRNRMSVMSIATDSTKLGEIPERRWRHNQGLDLNDDYRAVPTYPLKPFRTEGKQKKFLGLFKL